MAERISLGGRTLAGVENDEQGEVGGDTTFRFHRDDARIYARYSGGEIVDGHLVGTLDGSQWDVRYVQMNEDGETTTGHSVGGIDVLDDGLVCVEDE